jgi:hypothetical protein
VSDAVKGLVVPLPATSVGLVRSAFVAYLKPVADTAAPPVAVIVALSVAVVAVTELAAWVSTVVLVGYCRQRTEKPRRASKLRRVILASPELRTTYEG